MSGLLDQALDLEGPARQAWLDGLVRSDPALGEPLRRLFDGRERHRTAEMVQRGAVARLEAPREFAAGDRIGPYRLLRALGAGGMGEVWLAERADGALRRDVALKLPVLGLRRSVLLQRFERERDILASLEHPHIARLYDAGVTADGQPYLALEYVEGRPIDRWCAERGATHAERVHLVQQVAQAVAFAHSRLVLHRDLKPGNILVTADAQVRLLDFGIAKLIEADAGAAEATELTRLGGRALTPAYAAPEQLAGGNVSTATDVWALGVLLYELLAGRRPFEGTPREVEEAILQRDPPRPPGVPADLAAIASVALKKVPAERYATADALHDDLARWAAGQPVRARPPRLGYRLRMFGLRHRTALGAALLVLAAFGLALGAGATALVILVLLVGLGAALWQARRAQQQAALARAQTMRAEAEARTAHEVQAFLEDIFHASSAEQAEPVRGRQRTAKQLLDAGAARIEKGLQDAPEAALRLTRILAQMYEDMEEPAAAAAMLRRHQQGVAARFGAGSVENGQALASLGFMLAQAEDLPGAREALDAAAGLLHGVADPARRGELELGRAALLQRLDPAQSVEPAARALAALRAQPASGVRLTASALLVRGLHFVGRFDEARHEAEEALAAAADAPRRALGSVIDLHIELGRMAALDGAVEPLRTHFERAIALGRATVGEGGHHTLMAMVLLGQALLDNGQLAEGLGWLDRAACNLEQAPESAERRWQLPMFEEYAARARLQLGRPAAALRACEIGLAHVDLERNNPFWAVCLHALRAQALLQMRRRAEARAAIDAARALMTPQAPTRRSMLRPLVWAEAMWLVAAGRGADALAHWRAEQEAMDGNETGDVTIGLRQGLRGAALALATQPRAALDELDRVQAALEQRARPDGDAELHAQAQALRGEALRRLGQAAEGLASLEAALALGASIFDAETSPFLAACHLARGRALRALGRRQDARAAWGRARQLRGAACAAIAQ